MTAVTDLWTCPEPPIDPPDDDTECPACDAPLVICRADLAQCGACGWVNEPDFTDEETHHYDD